MTRSKADVLDSFDPFTCAYVACALFASTDESRDDGGDPLDSNYSSTGIELATLKRMQVDCIKFQAENADDLSGVDSGDAGHRFWLNRNGHGTGYWDYPEVYGEDGAKRLSDASRAYGETYLNVYRGRISGHND